MKVDEHAGDGAAEALVHRETFIVPVARRAEPPQLARDRPAGLRFPFPHMLYEGVGPNLATPDALCFQVALDHHLRGDAGMVGADHPQRILTLQPRVTDENVLQRHIQRVAEMQ